MLVISTAIVGFYLSTTTSPTILINNPPTQDTVVAGHFSRRFKCILRRTPQDPEAERDRKAETIIEDIRKEIAQIKNHYDYGISVIHGSCTLGAEASGTWLVVDFSKINAYKCVIATDVRCSRLSSSTQVALDKFRPNSQQLVEYVADTVSLQEGLSGRPGCPEDGCSYFRHLVPDIEVALNALRGAIVAIDKRVLDEKALRNRLFGSWRTRDELKDEWSVRIVDSLGARTSSVFLDICPDAEFVFKYSTVRIKCREDLYLNLSGSIAVLPKECGGVSTSAQSGVLLTIGRQGRYGPVWQISDVNLDNAISIVGQGTNTCRPGGNGRGYVTSATSGLEVGGLSLRRPLVRSPVCASEEAQIFRAAFQMSLKYASYTAKTPQQLELLLITPVVRLTWGRLTGGSSVLNCEEPKGDMVICFPKEELDGRDLHAEIKKALEVVLPLSVCL